MKGITLKTVTLALVLAIVISEACSFVRDGRELDRLRESVLRLHILANSDSEQDQTLKLKVRDELLANSGDIFGEASDIDTAKACAQRNIDEIEAIAEKVLTENGCDMPVSAGIARVYFDERTYGDITMPEGEYAALRVEIGQAGGKNWWCVMYPPLCLPAACSYEETPCEDTDTAEGETLFEDSQLDIMYHPGKYRVRFAVWDKIKKIFDI